MAEENTEGRPEATKTADLYQRHEQDPSGWVQADAVTGRPADKPSGNSTLADRAKAAKNAVTKQVDANQAEDKAVSKATTKRTRKA